MSGSYEVLWSMFLLGTFKFLFAAAPGAGLAVPFFETVAVTSFGAILSAMLFFISVPLYFNGYNKKTGLNPEDLVRVGFLEIERF